MVADNHRLPSNNTIQLATLPGLISNEKQTDQKKNEEEDKQNKRENQTNDESAQGNDKNWCFEEKKEWSHFLEREREEQRKGMKTSKINRESRDKNQHAMKGSVQLQSFVC
jgi:hypothetical protein